MRKLVIAMAVIGLGPAVHAQRGGPVMFTPYARANVVPETVKGAPYSADVTSESNPAWDLAAYKCERI